MTWYNEKSQLSHIGKGVLPEVWDEFRDAWYNDLEVLTQVDTKDEALRTANAYLTYYGARTKIIDVSWDLNDHCFVWEVQLPSSVDG